MTSEMVAQLKTLIEARQRVYAENAARANAAQQNAQAAQREADRYLSDYRMAASAVDADGPLLDFLQSLLGQATASQGSGTAGPTNDAAPPDVA